VAEDLGEKTEDPTSKKLEDARGKGQVAKSQDLAAAVMLLAAILIFIVLGPLFATGFAGITRGGLETFASYEGHDAQYIGSIVRDVGYQALVVVVPVMALMLLVAYVSNAGQIGMMFTTYPLEPKLDKLNPIAGTKRLFSKRNLVKNLINLCKLTVVIIVSYLVLSMQSTRVVGLPLLTTVGGMMVLFRLLAELALALVVLLLIIGVIDFMYQQWQHKQDLRMTKHEVKDERRTMEGDPQIKGRRNRMMQEIALQRAQIEVPKADVIVTNPTHYSVALRYDATKMRAPKVVAKGVDHMALRIRHIARAHGIVIVERPPLARGIYYGVDIGREIPAEFYEAVAEVLAYVYRLEQDAQASSNTLNTLGNLPNRASSRSPVKQSRSDAASVA
jgi:flagellar biosynthesis protein FlhB